VETVVANRGNEWYNYPKTAVISACGSTLHSSAQRRLHSQPLNTVLTALCRSRTPRFNTGS